jgi:DUF1016 N-terminal domain
VPAVTREMVLLYWQIGRDILQRQTQQGWGTKVIDRLAADLRCAFPDMTGFSPRNLRYMRAFAAAWPDEPIVQGPLAQITWYHTMTLLETGRSLNQLLDEALHLLLQRQSRQQPRRGEEPDRGDV